MNFLDTTAGSTHATNVAVELYMPPAEAATVLAYLDRCQALETKQHNLGELDLLRAEVKRLTPDPAHARQCRTAYIEKLVLLALDNATLLAALLPVDPYFRPKKVWEHLLEHKTRYKIEKPPSRAKIKEVMTKHGFML